MKVTGIHIEDFHQFKTLDIDLTYPKGHAKEGEPLEKVCIIGQSGTGKTKLLELMIGLIGKSKILKEKYTFSYDNGYISIKDSFFTFDKRLNKIDNPVYIASNIKKAGIQVENYSLFVSERNSTETKNWPNLIYYPAELKYEISDEKSLINNFQEQQTLDFSVERISSLWSMILKEVQAYQEQELSRRLDISRAAQDSQKNIEAITTAVKALEDWQKNNFNPIKDIAVKCLNPILKKFHLRVKTELDIQKKEDIGFIKIEDFNGNEIPYGLWSTGTKQVVLSALPLYILNPEHIIILFDEPERSLYPDLQKLIIDYYLSLTTDCQFFFSTHSPIIASSFEPWEIVELKFNNEGYVYQELYYEGERHVDNYTITPSYLTYDLMLSKVFDLKETYPPIRDEKITEVLMLRNQLEKLKKQDKLKTATGKKLYDRYIKLAQKLSWEFELPQYEEA